MDEAAPPAPMPLSALTSARAPAQSPLKMRRLTASGALRAMAFRAPVAPAPVQPANTRMAPAMSSTSASRRASAHAGSPVRLGVVGVGAGGGAVEVDAAGAADGAADAPTAGEAAGVGLGPTL